MITAELYKISKHRTPYVLTALGSVATLAPAVYYLFRRPESGDLYLDTAVFVFLGIGILLSAVFGGWVLGHEYRQGTVKRVIALDARRSRLLAAKLVAGTSIFIAMLATILAAGSAGAAVVAGIHGDSLVTDGFVRGVLGASFPMVVTALFAYGLSVIFRSDTYAMLSAVGVMTVFAPLIALIPRVGNYSLATTAFDVATRITEPAGELTNSFATSAGVTAAWLGVVGILSLQLFERRDV